jgi:hypothetical protein
MIHLFGFLKAFGISEFDAISQPISRSCGLIWLAAFCLFMAAAIAYLNEYDYWWIIGLLAVLVSQFLIIVYWSDAKYGTILNVIILVASILACSSFSFKKAIVDETSRMLTNGETSPAAVISEEMMSDLPDIVQKWLNDSGIVGKETISHVYIEQSAQMLMKPEQTDWYNATAKQYFTVEPPAFNWSVSLQMNPFMYVVGRDKFVDGNGEMIIKLFSLIPVVNAKENEKIDQATLQRYLAEIVWFPSAALSPYITWAPIDDRSVKATMMYKGTEGSGIFHFDEQGSFEKFTAMRYAEIDEKSEPKLWTVTATRSEIRNGVKVPVELSAKWKLDGADWTWLKLKITDIEYGVTKYRK